MDKKSNPFSITGIFFNSSKVSIPFLIYISSPIPGIEVRIELNFNSVAELTPNLPQYRHLFYFSSTFYIYILTSQLYIFMTGIQLY